jgi:ATP-binding cassette subfamily C exporter for protease/lipase
MAKEQNKSAKVPARSAVRVAVAAQRGPIQRAAALSLVIGLLMLLPAWFMFEVYGRVLNSQSTSTLAWLAVMMAGGFVILELIEYVRGRVLYQAGLNIEGSLRQRIFDLTFRASLAKGPGATSQAVIDLKTLREFAASPAFTAMLDLPAAALMLIIMFVISPWLGALTLLGALVQAAIAWSTERKTMPTLGQAIQANAQTQVFSNGALRNAQVIEAMGMMSNVYQRWAQKHRRFLAAQTEASDAAGLNGVGAKLVQTMQGSLLLGAGCWLALHNNLMGGPGMAMTASIIGARALAPMAQLIGQWRLWVNARDARNRLDALLAMYPKREETLSLPAPKGVLTIESLTAGPPGNNAPTILRGVSAAAAPGEVLGILGSSASGKTTLARALVGVWPPQAGTVRLDSADVYLWNKEELGVHIGYLPQGIELFDGTISENIARFGDIDPAKVRAAAEVVGLAELIESLPAGYDTLIGEEGAILSGGQRQRLGIARALYGDPQLVVLDEPNASLDVEGDKMLLNLLMQLKKRGATVVVITHRTSLLPAMDRLLVLTDGRAAMFGARDEVLAAMREAAAKRRQPAAAPPPVSTDPRTPIGFAGGPR